MAIKIKNIKKTFNNKTILTDINLIFPDNSISCIVGPSGCGKTTLLNIILGLLKADDGEIEGLDGRSMSAVFQEDRLCEGFTAYANIKLVCNPMCSEEVICENLKQVDLKDAALKKVSQLSGGMRRRVAIVRAVMANSDIMVMDEPFKGLDEKTKKNVIDYVKINSKNKIVIITTHNLEEIEMLEATLVNM